MNQTIIPSIYDGFNVRKNESSAMDIEEIEEIKVSTADSSSVAAADFDFSKPEVRSSRKSTTSGECHSKDSLKFCRRLTNLVEQELLIQTELVQRMLGFNTEILESFLKFLGINIQLEPSQLTSLQYDCLLSLWAKFRDVLSYSKNKKICIVNEKHWNHMFEKKTFTEEAIQVLSELAKKKQHESLRVPLNDVTFCEIFSRILFSTNKMLVIVSVLKDNSPRGKFIRQLETVENFVIMIMMPELMKYYNHRRGKFAVECCGKCKVRCSKTVASGFGNWLEEARQKKYEIVTKVDQIFSLYDQWKPMLIFHLMEFAFDQF